MGVVTGAAMEAASGAAAEEMAPAGAAAGEMAAAGEAVGEMAPAGGMAAAGEAEEARPEQTVAREAAATAAGRGHMCIPPRGCCRIHCSRLGRDRSLRDTRTAGKTRREGCCTGPGSTVPRSL